MVREVSATFEKPRNLEDYKKWLKSSHNVEVNTRLKNHYDLVANTIRKQFAESDLWTHLISNLPDYESEYLMKNKYPLLMHVPKHEMLIKPFDSFIGKTFRKNVLLNNNWPDEPKNGWYLPDNWFSRINDIVRTTLVVKYLDGVEFMIGKINEISIQNNVGFKYFLECREEGYYAAHIYLKQNFEVPNLDWDTKIINTSVEIQLSTQLQDVICKLLHKYYEKKRNSTEEKKEKWQWNYNTEEFAANYLGHILHYVEGMIMEVREKQKVGEKNETF